MAVVVIFFPDDGNVVREPFFYNTILCALYLAGILKIWLKITPLNLAVR